MNLDRATNIDGWMSGPELQLLAKFASKSHQILEIGSYKGRSTRAIADNTNGTVTVVDPWDGEYKGHISRDSAHVEYKNRGSESIYQEFLSNLLDHFLNKKLIIFRGTFESFSIYAQFDFIFIDAIHEYQLVKHDINKARALISPNGIIAGHDYSPSWPGVMQAVDEVFPDRKLYDTIWYIGEK